MDYRNIIFLLFVSLLLFGTVCAQKTVNDFVIDSSYTGAFNGNDHSLYLNNNKDSGIAVFKMVDGDLDEDDAYDDLIHDEGSDYLYSSEDVKVDKNPDNTFNFTDYDHGEHGVGEVINDGNESFVVIFWAKDSSNINNADLMSLLTQFNKDNKAAPVAY